MSTRIEGIVGRYAHIEIDGKPHRLYFEEAGQGIPLLCLHTAGSDGRQFRAVLNDPLITRHFRVLAFDMPWHGKSSPPAGWEKEDYKLTTGAYTDQIMTVARALGLERPVVMGCSIGGRIVLDLALKHAADLRALVGLQSAAYVERYYESAWLNHAEVHGGQACGAIAYGLMSPLSPDVDRWETVWHYMQGGPGVFTGDLFFYQVEGDIRARATCSSIRWKATFARASAPSTPRCARSTCSPANTIIPLRPMTPKPRQRASRAPGSPSCRDWGTFR